MHVGETYMYYFVHAGGMHVKDGMFVVGKRTSQPMSGRKIGSRISGHGTPRDHPLLLRANICKPVMNANENLCTSSAQLNRIPRSLRRNESFSLRRSEEVLRDRPLRLCPIVCQIHSVDVTSKNARFCAYSRWTWDAQA